MKDNLSNDQNLKNLKKREILRILIIILALCTIVLALLNLFYGVHILFAFGCYLGVVILTKIRNSTPIVLKEDEFQDIRNEIETTNKKYGKKVDNKKKKSR